MLQDLPLATVIVVDMNEGNWSAVGDLLTRVQAVSGVHGVPWVSMMRTSKKFMPCFAAVDR